MDKISSVPGGRFGSLPRSVHGNLLDGVKWATSSWLEARITGFKLHRVQTEQQAFGVILSPLTVPCRHLSAWLAYLMDAEVGIRVEVVVPWCHFLRADELGNLASSRTGGQGRYMRRVGDAGHMVGSRHWFRQWGRLGWLREWGRDRLLPLFRRDERERRCWGSCIRIYTSQARMWQKNERVWGFQGWRSQLKEGICL